MLATINKLSVSEVIHGIMAILVSNVVFEIVHYESRRLFKRSGGSQQVAS